MSDVVVFDTNVFVRCIDERGFKDALKRLIKKCDKIVISKKILIKEWKNYILMKGIPPSGTFRRRVDELRRIKKLKIIGKSKINAKQKNIRLNRKPDDKSDVKFLNLAIIEGAKYIITRDRHLLDLHPIYYDNRKKRIDIIRPEEYEMDLTHLDTSPRLLEA